MTKVYVLRACQLFCWTFECCSTSDRKEVQMCDVNAYS